MTNEQMAARLEKHADMSATVAESFRNRNAETAANFDGFVESLRAGAQALLEVDKLRADLAEELQVHQRIRAAKNQFVEERDAAQREVERLREALRSVKETWVKWPPLTESLAHQEHFNRGIIEPVDAALKEASDAPEQNEPFILDAIRAARGTK